MPLPHIISCLTKIQNASIVLVLAYPRFFLELLEEAVKLVLYIVLFFCMSCIDDGVDLPSSSSDEDKTEAEEKTAAPATGPVSQLTCGNCHLHILLSACLMVT